MLKRILVFAGLVFLFTAESFSQQYFFRSFSVEDGLPQSSLYCLLQDSRGFIWMGTNGAGVVRFDGQTFEAFSKSDGLSDNVVRSIFEDSKGNIWFGTGNGLTVYDGFTFKSIGKEQGLFGNAVMKIIEGSDGIIWAAAWEGGLAGITMNDSVSVKTYSKDDGLVSNYIFDIYEDKAKKLWLGMVGGVNIIEFDNSIPGHVKSIFKPDIKTQSVATILSIEPGNAGDIWLGSLDDGLFSAASAPGKEGYKITPSVLNKKYPGLRIWDMLNRKDGELWIATDNNGVIRLKDGNVIGVFDKDSGLQSNQITDLLEDREGDVWFASYDQGAMMYDDDKFLTYNEKDGIMGNQVLDVLFTGDNIFYLATERGLLQFKKEGSGIKRLNYFSSGNGLNSPGVNTLTKTWNGRIWVGTKNGINILNGALLSSFKGNNNLEYKDISCLLSDSRKNLWIGTAGGFGKLSGDNLYLMSQDEQLINNEVQTIIEDRKGRIWMGTQGGLVRLEDTTYTDFNEEDGLTTLKINALAEDISGNILIGTFGGGIFKFDISKDSVPISVLATKGLLGSNTVNSLLFIRDTMLAAGTDKGFDLIVLDSKQGIKKVISYNISDGFTGGEANQNSVASDNDGMIWFGTKKGLVRYNPAIDFNYRYLPETCIKEIRLFYKKVDWSARNFKVTRFSGLPDKLVLSHKDNHLTFYFTGLSYQNPDELEFSYYLENQSKEWSPFSRNRERDFTGLQPGSYTFKVRAKNKFGVTGLTSDFSFVIKPPFWKTPWFLIPAFILLIVLIVTFIRVRIKSLVREKEKLEKIVEERTREVVEQKDEILRQRDVVLYQKKEITDSIQYAERIQRAVLPEESILKNHFSDYFVLFRPKDIVSGDFYWMSKKDDHIVFTAADCTGHGVPGAFMSLLGVSFLNKLVNESGLVHPAQILNSLRENIVLSLKQKGSFETTKDGMDIALCSVDLKNMNLQFAGANNPLFLISKESDEYVVNETKGDKMPVGFYSRMDPFTNHSIDLHKGDTIYLFSDGFLDQFGGPEGRKFMKPRFRQMLVDNQHLDMDSQKLVFSRTLDEWINDKSEGNTSPGQVDDIILLGVRV